jgi:hypothetical protein
LLFGFVFTTAGLSMVVASVPLKNELQNLISSPVIAFFVCVVAVAAVLAVASLALWLGTRVLVGSFRRNSDRSGNA